MKARVVLTLMASEEFPDAPRSSMTIDTELETAPNAQDTVYISNFYGFDWQGVFHSRPTHHMFTGQLGEHLPLYHASVYVIRRG